MSKDNLTLDLVSKSEWFDKIKSGEKTVEYRETKPYWRKRIYPLIDGEFSFPIVFPGNGLKQGAKVHFSRGYARHEQMLFMIDKISVVPGDITDLHTNKPVFAIHLGERIY